MALSPEQINVQRAVFAGIVGGILANQDDMLSINDLKTMICLQIADGIDKEVFVPGDDDFIQHTIIQIAQEVLEGALTVESVKNIISGSDPANLN